VVQGDGFDYKSRGRKDYVIGPVAGSRCLRVKFVGTGKSAFFHKVLMHGVNGDEQFVVGGQVPVVSLEFVSDHLNDAGRAVEMKVPGPVQGGAQHLIKANQMIDVAVADKYMAGLENFSGRKLMQISEIKEEALTAVAVVEEKSRVAEGRVEGFYVPGWEQQLFS